MTKKALLTTVLGMVLATTAAQAQIVSECMYAPEQEMIRQARSFEDLKPLEGKDLSQAYPCGGTILQLATLRGIAEVLLTLRRNNMVNFDTEMSTKDYPIPGAPEMIPAILFAGRWAPNQETFQAFLDAGLDPFVKDAAGHDLKWYLARNPVMHHSDYTEYPPEVAWNKLSID